MLLKLLDRLGRKKVVLDRGPSHPRFIDAKTVDEQILCFIKASP